MTASPTRRPVLFLPGLLCDERLWRGLPRPSFHLFHRCGHLPPLEQPDETSAVLRRWLATTP